MSRWSIELPWRQPARWVLLDAGLWCADTQRWLPAANSNALPHLVSRWDVWAAGSVLQQLVCPTGLPLSQEHAVVAYARQLFAHYHGAAARRWSVAPWRSGAVRGASALTGQHFDAMQVMLVAHTAQLGRLRPLWAAALNWAAQQRPQLQRQAVAQIVLVEGVQLTWLRLERGCCVDVQPARLAAPTWEDLAQALDDRGSEVAAPVTVLGYGLMGSGRHLPTGPGYQVLGVLDAAGPPAAWLKPALWGKWAHKLPRPQFGASATRRPPALAWVSLLSAAAVFATAAFQAHDHWQTRLAGRALLQASETNGPDGNRPAASAIAPVTPQARAAQVKLSQALHRPWGQWLAGIETAAGNRAQWLELDHDTQTASAWRLRGQAPDHVATIAVATGLEQQPEWRQARVTRLQGNPRDLPPSFELEAFTADAKAAPP